MSQGEIMTKPEKNMQAYAKMMAAITTALADALRDGIAAESIIAALNNLITVLEEE
jgi:hypothetical protein